MKFRRLYMRHNRFLQIVFSPLLIFWLYSLIFGIWAGMYFVWRGELIIASGAGFGTGLCILLFEIHKKPKQNNELSIRISGISHTIVSLAILLTIFLNLDQWTLLVVLYLFTYSFTLAAGFTGARYICKQTISW